MAIYSHKELLNALLVVTKPSEVRDILRQIGDHTELVPGEAFGSNHYRWMYYGNRESNVSSVNLGSKPGRSLTERITNAIDAVLEKRMARAAGVEPPSPMEAAMRWFGRPPSSPDNGLFAWKGYSPNEYDQLVRLVLVPGDADIAPTVDVIDSGIGIQPSDFSKTILSLQEGNKIKKRYLAGAFGQGGSATLAFCDYALVVSRHMDSPDIVGFTIIKLMRLGEGFKEDAYVYLAVPGEDGQVTVPSCEGKEPVDPYLKVSSGKPKAIDAGTLIRHYGYRLDGLEKTLSPSPGNLYHLLQYMMFDPLLPFRVIDLRKEGAFKDELITGSRNRLMKYTDGTKKDKEEGETQSQEEAGTELRHHFIREMVSPRGDEGPTIGIEYWVPLNRRKTGDKITLRAYSNELFVDRNHPILGTLNGQNQGEMTARILKELELPMVARHIVVHIDATQASSDTRRRLFASTREGFKEGDILSEITRVLINMLKEDEKLYEIEKELLEGMLKKSTSETTNEVKKEITDLLRNAGFVGKDPGETLVASEEGTNTVEAPTRKGRKPQHRAEPLPTLPYPQVTRFEIVYPEGEFSVHKQDNQSIRIETDADFRFDRLEKIGIRIEPPALEVASKSALQGGRMHWRLRPTQEAKPGDKGQVIAALTKPDGSQLTASVNYEVLPAREQKARKEQALIPAFEIIAVDPEADADIFDQVWGDLGKDEVAAYKQVRTMNGLKIYYSTAFPSYREQVEKLKTQPTLSTLFTKNYEIWIGYHAIIQDQQRPSAVLLFDMPDEELDRVQEHERTVVAEMQVKQAMKMAELQNQTLKQKSAD